MFEVGKLDFIGQGKLLNFVHLIDQSINKKINQSINQRVCEDDVTLLDIKVHMYMYMQKKNILNKVMFGKDMISSHLMIENLLLFICLCLR